MEGKSLIWLGMAAGSTVGGLIPALWGAGFTSFSSIILAGIGGFAGIWVGFKMSR